MKAWLLAALGVLVLFNVSCTQPNRVNTTRDTEKLFPGVISGKPVNENALDRIEAHFALWGCGIVFCTEYYSDDRLSYRPVILRKNEVGGWEKCDFDVEPFARGTSWDVAYRSLDGKRMWAIAEWHVEGPGETLEIVSSKDAGKTWRHIASIPKPSYMAGLHSFSMDDQGSGAVTIYLEAEAGYRDAGYYRSYTKDWGKTWTPPRLEQRDDLVAAPERVRDTALPKVLRESVGTN